jgi:DnaA-homolog protein
MTQLLLDLTGSPLFTFENLIMHAGIERAVATIQSVYSEVQRQLPPLFLCGPAGTGKTHILHAAASLVASFHGTGPGSAKIISPTKDALPSLDLDDLESRQEGQGAGLSCIAVDDVHVLAPNESARLWSLYNQTNRRGAPLMMASRVPANELFRDDPHLTSRVAAGLVFHLEPPEDNVRILIMDKMARDRQVRISREVCHYLVTRKSRNVNELSRLLEILDRTSLELQRRITLPLIKMLEKEGSI